MVLVRRADAALADLSWCVLTILAGVACSDEGANVDRVTAANGATEDARLTAAPAPDDAQLHLSATELHPGEQFTATVQGEYSHGIVSSLERWTGATWEKRYLLFSSLTDDPPSWLDMSPDAVRDAPTSVGDVSFLPGATETLTIPPGTEPGRYQLKKVLVDERNAGRRFQVTAELKISS